MTSGGDLGRVGQDSIASMNTCKCSLENKLLGKFVPQMSYSVHFF